MYHLIFNCDEVRRLVYDVHEESGQVGDHEDAGQLPGEDEVQADDSLVCLVPEVGPVCPPLYDVLASRARSQVSELRDLQVRQVIVRSLDVEIQLTDLFLEGIGAHALKETCKPDPFFKH